MGRTKQRRIQASVSSNPVTPYFPPEALLVRAEELLGSCDFELARRFVERALERRPSDAKALELLATIELEFDQSDSAKEVGQCSRCR